MTNSLPISKQQLLTPNASFFRITVDEYHDLINRNILTTEERVELLEGLLVQKTAHNNRHSSTVVRLSKKLLHSCPDEWQVLIKLPVTLRTSEPEPDAAIVRGNEHTFDLRHPGPSDFGIVIEVADTSLMLDRREKGRIYAEAGIPEYWVVNIPERQVEVNTSPDPNASPAAYRDRTGYGETQSVPLVLDGKAVGAVSVGVLLPTQ